MIFDSVGYAQQELVPILRAIEVMTEESGDAQQCQFFRGIKAGFERAAVAEDLADPLMALSASAFMGFEINAATAMLLDQLLERAQGLAASLDAEPDGLH